MKRAIFLVTMALLVMLVFAPVALAQEATVTVMEGTVVTLGPTGGGIPDTGGPAILLPAVALLLGTGILTYAILRRR